MDFKKLSPWETAVIVFCVIVFLSLSLLVIFKRESLDGIFFGPVSQEEAVVEEDSIDQLFNEQDSDLVGFGTLATLEIVPEGEKAALYLNLDGESRITGLELFLEKDESLTLGDFVCIEPFECVLFESTESTVSILAVIPPGLVELLPLGRQLVGEFLYTGEGTLYLDLLSKSFVSAMENPDVNILSLQESIFLLK